MGSFSRAIQNLTGCIRAAFGLCLLVLLCASPLAAQDQQLSPLEAKKLAKEQLATNPAATVALARALLELFPKDYDALMLLAAALIGLEEYEGAVDAAKKAFQVAPRGTHRLNAARLVSSAHFRSNHFTRAEWWLRRAANNAVDGPAQLALSQDFNAVRQANPFSVKLGFSLAPNSNINNGSLSEFIYIWNLPFRLSPDARALAGYEASANVDLAYRLSESPVQTTDVGLSLFGQTYKLTADAAAAAPGISGSDYAFAVAELSFNHMRQFSGLSGPSTVNLIAGKNWYGGDPYTRYNALTLGQEFGLGRNTSLSFSVSGRHEVSIRDGDIPSDTVSASAKISHRMINNDLVAITLGMDETKSTDIGRENTAKRVQIAYQIGRPVLGMALSTNISYEEREYGFSVYDPSGRFDETIGLEVTAVFLNFTYFGFSPSVSLEASKTSSNVALFEKESAGLRFGIQSTF